MPDENSMKILENPILYRDEYLKKVRLELLGPVSSDDESLQNSNLASKPTDIFSCGVLYPYGFVDFYGMTQFGGEEVTTDADPTLPDEDDRTPIEGGREQTVDEGREEVELDFDDGDVADDVFSSHQNSQCSFGISFISKADDKLSVKVGFGTYSEKVVEENGRNLKKFSRKQHLFTLELDLGSNAPAGVQKLGDTEVELRYQCYSGSNASLHITFWVTNRKEPINPSEIWQNCIYQPELLVTNDRGFISLGLEEDRGLDEDTRSYALLYRNKKSYCRGHGCSGFWTSDEDGVCRQVRNEFFPVYEIMPILPVGAGDRFKGIDFSFYGNSKLDKGLSNADSNSELISNAELLCEAYHAWILDCQNGLAVLPEHLHEAGNLNLDACKSALGRMRNGVRRLNSNNMLMRAFRLANHAMWLQQVRGGIKSRFQEEPYPEINMRDEKNINRGWRPFQLAFILMNIDGLPLGDSINHEDSSIVDLIWFPTGGGKTEAYLGVAAIALCFSRLIDVNSRSTEVIMRYTLRLLTSQQFQRATYLILSLEFMRQEGMFEDERIKESADEFSAGLWVGRELTPNRVSDAYQHLKRMRTSGKKNKFAILECPWCKASLERSLENGIVDYPGYVSYNAKQFRFTCPDRRCFFGGESSILPIYVIDEQLYENPPSLLLSTVDKFALLPWIDGPQKFLGKTSGKPPSLVIQDELHLISGPLGSVVGHYEELLFGLMRSVDSARTTKIIASTATIRRAKEQVNGLYNRSVAAFPPQGIDYDDSFFAREAKKGETAGEEEIFGRRYVGVFAASDKSVITSQVKLLSALLQLPMQFTEGLLPEKNDENFKDGNDLRKLPDTLDGNFNGVDPYGTLVWYFNSIRELSYADSLLSQDIVERNKILCRRYQIPFGLRRRAVNKKELTSRTKEFEIFEILKRLGVSWTPERRSGAIDVLLATSMISVGVDIDRLGLMVITGQPKNTSEYIQASSRVGRKEPGLVFTLYNQNRARDRSHFETFKGYHQAIYRHVEPTSVTPYSYKCRERALPGLLIGIARHELGLEDPLRLNEIEKKLMDRMEDYFSRVAEASGSEDDVGAARFQLNELLEEWKEKVRYAEDNNQKLNWGKNFGTVEQYDLLKSFGQIQDENDFQAIGMMTSMRNVDVSSSVQVVF
jgi:hypothetical protein